ncbi:MAG: mechanosensitive ion channel protein MscS [Alloprevotella sp.]
MNRNTSSPDYLERLQHPEREPERKRNTGNLFLRNILNAVFMLLAAACMTGLLILPAYKTQCYIVGLIAVVIKMVEVILRMPGLKK